MQFMHILSAKCEQKTQKLYFEVFGIFFPVNIVRSELLGWFMTSNSSNYLFLCGFSCGPRTSDTNELHEQQFLTFVSSRTYLCLTFCSEWILRKRKLRRDSWEAKVRRQCRLLSLKRHVWATEPSCGPRDVIELLQTQFGSNLRTQFIFYVLFEEFTQIPGLYFGMKIVVFLFSKGSCALWLSLSSRSDVNTPHGFGFLDIFKLYRHLEPLMSTYALHWNETLWKHIQALQHKHVSSDCAIIRIISTFYMEVKP